jgi:hypothetical protein
MSASTSRVVRRSANVLALAALLLLAMAPVPAAAAPPEGWPETEAVSVTAYLLLLLVIPLGLALVIALLASVPRMVRGDRYTPGLAWRNETEWFGGPKDGLEAADRTDPKALEGESAERGGASARW